MCFYSVVKLFGAGGSSWQKHVLKLSLGMARNKQLEMHIMNYNCFPLPRVGVMYVIKFHSNSLQVRSLTLLSAIFLKYIMVETN